MIVLMLSIILGEVFRIEKTVKLPEVIHFTQTKNVSAISPFLFWHNKIFVTNTIYKNACVYIIDDDGIDSIKFTVGEGPDELELAGINWSIKKDTLYYLNMFGMLHYIDIKGKRIVRKRQLYRYGVIIQMKFDTNGNIVTLTPNIVKAAGIRLFGDCINIYGPEDYKAFNSFYNPPTEFVDYYNWGGAFLGFFDIYKDTLYIIQNFKPFLYKFTTDGKRVLKRNLRIPGFITAPPQGDYVSTRDELLEKGGKWMDSWTPIIASYLVPEKYIVLVIRKKGGKFSLCILNTNGKMLIGNIDLPKDVLLYGIDPDEYFYFIKMGYGGESYLSIRKIKDSALPE